MVKLAHLPPKPGGSYSRPGKKAVQPHGTVKGAGRKRRAPVVIQYDPEARKDYLTGFSKRKKERQDKAIEEAEVKLKEAKQARRDEIRERVNSIRALASGETVETLAAKEKENAEKLNKKNKKKSSGTDGDSSKISGEEISDGSDAIESEDDEIVIDQEEYVEEAEVTTVVTTAFNAEGDAEAIKQRFAADKADRQEKELRWNAESESDDDVEDIAAISANRQKIQEARYALKEFKKSAAPELKVKVKGANKGGKKNPHFTPKVKGGKRGKAGADEPKKRTFGKKRGTKGKRG